MLIGKRRLAEKLGWARTRLDRRLQSDPNFPVVAKGDQAGGWQFDLAAVMAHLDGTQPPAEAETGNQGVEASTAGARAHIPDLRRHAGGRSAEHKGEATARQRRDLADAALKEAQLRKERSQLIVRSDLRQALTAVLASIHADLDRLPDLLVKQCELPADAEPVIAKMVGAVRAQLDRNAQPILEAKA